MVKKIVEQGFIPQKPPTELTQLLSLVRQYLAPAEVERIALASQLALETCLGIEGERPIPPLEHALAVTTILAQIHIDSVGIAAGLVFEAVDADLLSLERVERELGAVTARVVGSMLRLNILERKKRSAFSKNGRDEHEDIGGNGGAESKKPRIREALRRQQAETVRKMFVAMADDPRVVLLKLAYRLHAMRIMCRPGYQGNRQEMLTMAQETREIYAPLAGRLGISRVESVCKILRREMAWIGVKADVSGRVKHLYSFYKKLARSATAVDSPAALKAAADIGQIHDLIAFRILVDSTQDCYVALGHVHSLWKPKEGRIRDFIANPKPNGYRALHTTVFCQDNQLVEIQIRTHAMHEMAEYGVAMHWHYKDVGDNASASAKELLSWLRQLNEWQRDIRSSNASDTEFMEAIKDDIFQEQIFVFTPKGEVKDLPVGSTPLDFAYRIHSEVGDSCAGARIITQAVTGEDDRLVTRMVPLDYELKSGEIVDIVTNRSAHPTRDWLIFARTAAARSKIRRYLKIHERHINIQIGRERLDRELKGTGRVVESMTEDAENWLCNEFHMETFEDILSAIGADDIRPHAAVVKLQEYWQLREGKEAKESEEPLVLPVATGKPAIAARVQVAGVSGLLTKLANCCCPLPSDEIVGFISRGKGVVVHRADCRNLERARKREGERLVNVSWVSMSHPRYQAPIIITARDRAGLIRDIAAVVSDGGINLTAMSSHANGNHEPVLITATLEIENLDQLQRVFARIEKVKDVMHVERDLGKKR